MNSLLARLKADPEIYDIISLHGDTLLAVLYELKTIDLSDCTNGQELVERIVSNPKKVDTLIFYSENLIWLLRTGLEAVALVTRNYQKMRDYIAGNPHTPDTIKSSMLVLVDKIILQTKQRCSN